MPGKMRLETEAGSRSGRFPKDIKTSGTMEFTMRVFRVP